MRPGGIGVTVDVGWSGFSFNSDTKAIEFNIGLFTGQVYPKKGSQLSDDMLTDWVERIASEEMIHYATVEVISEAEAAEAWRKLGKSKAGQKLQAEAMRLYNFSFEQEGKTAPKLTEAASYYEFVRMAIQKTEFRGMITEAALAEPSLKADILAFLQRIADILTQRIAALPKAARAALEPRK